jgi:cytochrome c nitrite reductase small subunit
MTLATAIGAAAGVGGYTFVYAKGASYMTDAPEACANCHVMREAFDGWTRSSHHAVAVCNDCHTPSGFLAKYATKATNGLRHSFAFTTGRFPDPLRIHPSNRAVADAACRKCHEDVVQAMEGSQGSVGGSSSNGGRALCATCHASVGHPR